MEIVPIEFPEADEVTEAFPVVTPTELLSGLGRERFLAIRDRMDRNVATRVAHGLEVTADRYISLKRRQAELGRATEMRMQGLDGIVSPTVPVVAVPEEKFTDSRFEQEFHRTIPWNTRPANVLGLCATSTPVQTFGSALPVGLQVLGAGFREEKVLAIALAVERVVGPPQSPDLSQFFA